MGRNYALSGSDVLDIMRKGSRPVWSASQIGQIAGVTRATATKRLKTLAEEGRVETVEVGSTRAYYLVGITTEPAGDPEDGVRRDLRRSFEDKFVGLPTSPWTAVNETDGAAQAGEKVQLQVEGRPGNWGHFMTRLERNRRQELQYSECDEGSVQALITGELYAKPTVPIEHSDYPDDYDLELNIGAEIKGEPPHQALVAAGVKNHLIRPVNDAVFLKNVEVDWICLLGQGQEIPSVDLRKPEPDAPGSGSTETPPSMPDIDPESEGGSSEYEAPKRYDDIVMLSGHCDPARAYIDKLEADRYRVLPSDFSGDELEAEYEPTEEFKTEVREKTAVEGELQFERTWLDT